MDKISTQSKFSPVNNKILNLLRFYKGIDRSELGRRLQLSMPTIYKAIDELNSENIVNKTESSVVINANYGALVGISIGTSLCKIIFLNFDFQKMDASIFLYYKANICKQIGKVSTNDELLQKCTNDDSKQYIYFKTPKTFQNLKNILDNVFECLKNFICKQNLNILSIGISCTGIINNKTQTILNAHNLKYLSNRTLDSLIFPDKQLFFASKDIQISLVQNSNASVIAEKIYLNQINSPYKTKENVIALYLGVGNGAGIYLGHLYPGTNGHAGEAGHTKAPVCESQEDIERHEQLVADGTIDSCCTCGCDDCYDYKIRSYVFEKSVKDFCEMTAEQMRLYLKDNPDKAKLLGKYWGNMVNTITSWMDVDLIIFTGKIYKSMDLLINHIVSIQDENPLEFNRNDCTILTSTYGSLSPSIGAAIYAYHQKFNLDLSWNY